MTDHEAIQEGARDRSLPWALISWFKQAARTAVMLAPRWERLHPNASVIAAVVLIHLFNTLILQRLNIGGPAVFDWRAIDGGWISVAFLGWLCYWVRREVSAEPHSGIAPSTAHLITMVLAQWMIMDLVFGVLYLGLARADIHLGRLVGLTGMLAVWWTPGIWMLLAQMVLLLRCGDRRRRARLGAISGAAVMAAILFCLGAAQFWHADDSHNASAVKRLDLTQELIEAQQQLFAQRLENIKPGRPGVIDLYSITYAPFQDAVFRRESEMVDQVMRKRFDAEGRTVQLVNDPQTPRQFPWATPLNLRRAIQQFAHLMDRDEDILFIHLTSHGASDGQLASNFWPLDVPALKPSELKKWLDEAGIRNRVISISACYSGGWIDALADDNTLVITAADSDHTSYGCGSKSELTFFGRAMYDEQLRNVTWSFEKAYQAARVVIKRREEEAGKDDGYSNPQIKAGAAIQVRLGKLEARLRSEQTRQK